VEKGVPKQFEISFKGTLRGDQLAKLVSQFRARNIEIVQPVTDGFEDVKLRQTRGIVPGRAMCKLGKVRTHNSRKIGGIEEITIHGGAPELNISSALNYTHPLAISGKKAAIRSSLSSVPIYRFSRSGFLDYPHDVSIGMQMTTVDSRKYN
jgi:hypothetical protein